MFQKIINNINVINNKNNNIVNVVVFVLFAILTFAIGINHEPWFDEAQSWLIARDCSFYEIIFERCRYEGTPFLWFIILKLFILIHWNYEFLFVISWLFSCLGIYLFLFKSRFTNITKSIFPFTYFIFYQYAIVARSYCLIFPILCLIAIFYTKRFDRQYLYSFLLVILASICAFSCAISFVLLCFYVVELSLLNKNSKIKDLFVKNGAVIILLIYFILIFFICRVPVDRGFIVLQKISLQQIFAILLQGYFLYVPRIYILEFIEYIICLGLYFYLIKIFCKSAKQIMFFIILNLILLIFIVILTPYAFAWHVGVLMLILVFSCWIFKNENNISFIPIETNKVFFIIFVITCVAQLFLSISISIDDINKQYDCSKDVALYIKQNNYTSNDIACIGESYVAIQPYFKENICCNSYFTFANWGKKNFKDHIELTNKVLDNVKIIIADQYINEDKYTSIRNKMDIYGFKEKYVFIPNIYTKEKLLLCNIYMKEKLLLDRKVYTIYTKN